MADTTSSQLVIKPADPTLVATAASLLLAQAGLVAPDGYEDEFGFHFGTLPSLAAGATQPEPLSAAMEIRRRSSSESDS